MLVGRKIQGGKGERVGLKAMEFEIQEEMKYHPKLNTGYRRLAQDLH